jgi:long-chain acyl-CoA synthetase
VPNVPALCAALNLERPADIGARQAFVERAEVRGRIAAAVDAVNVHLAQFEQIKKFALLPAEFSQANGELTPTLKVKRRVVEEKYRDVIEKLYG